ncbi:MAG: M23 family metallopeptidase [Mangrovibacterium sp.]
MRLIYILFFILSPFISSAQRQVRAEDKNYFQAPLQIPLLLSGNFGEVRNNHFHSGIDIKTQGKTGLKVYAPADGTVSRIKVSPYGYGLALYIDHPNGYTSVYGHLNGYNKEISDFVKAHQYQRESFAVDIAVPAGTFDIKQGEVIAFSGNTGGSGGPHLHFEIRDTKSEHPINPLLFNFDIKDSTPPVIKGLMAYPMTKNSTINGKHQQQSFKIDGRNGNYSLAPNEQITANGTIGLALYVQDFLNGSHNRCGIFENTLLVNNENIYTFRMDEFDFEDSKYVNSYIDYAYLVNNKIRYQKCFVDVNNKMPNFHSLKGQGTFSIQANDTSSINFVISDVHGNESLLKFNILGERESEKTNSTNATSELCCFEPQEIKTPHAKATFSAKTFFTKVEINAFESEQSPFSLSPIIQIGSPEIAIHHNFKLEINAQNSIPKWGNQTAIVLLDDKNEVSKYYPTQVKNNLLSAYVGELGKFTLAIDSIKPEIKALSIDNNQSLNNPKQINFKITDKQSGIASWRGEIDGEWVLFEYEYKQDKLFYIFDEKRLQLNKQHQLKLIVNDALGNSTTYEASFFK